MMSFTDEQVREVVRSAVSQAFEAYDHGYNANRYEMIDQAASSAARELTTTSRPRCGLPSKKS